MALYDQEFARSPGVGQPGSNVQTDETNLRTAAAMERGDRGNRFGFGSQEYLQNTDNPAVLRASRDTGSLVDQALEGRRAMLAQGIDPDRPAIAPDRKRRTEMLHESVALSHAAHQSFEDRQNLNAVNETGALHNELANPPKGIRIGTPEYGNWVYGLATKYPNGAMTGAGMRSLERVAGLHDRAAAITGQPAVDLTIPEGFQVDHYTEDTKGNRRTVLKPVKKVDFDSAVSIRVGDWDKDKPTEFVGNSAGPIVRIDTGKTSKQGKAIVEYMPIKQYLEAGGKLSTADQKAQQNDSTGTTATANAISGKVLKYNPKTGRLE